MPDTNDPPDALRPPDEAWAERRREPVLNAPPVTVGLLLILGAVWLALRLAPVRVLGRTLEWFALVPARFSEALATGDVPALAAASVTVLTHALLHVDGLHLAVNAGMLLAFGSLAERGFGTRRYLLLLAVTAVAGGLLQLAFDWGRPIAVIGASGAVSGCMGAFAGLLIRAARGTPQRRMGWGFIAGLVALNLLLALVGGGLVGVDAAIAWQAHLGGLAAGLLLAPVLARGR